MQITIHRGTHQIGGSVIELSHDGERILLDAGLPLDASTPNASRLPETLDPNGLAAILLSHAHPDHYGLIEQIPETVPVYMTDGTSKALLASSLFAGTRSLKRERQRTVRNGETLQIGPYSVTSLNVDHSAFDAVAYSIRCEDKHLLYTGDLRTHGRKPGMLQKLKSFCKEHPIDLLVTEGTRIGQECSKSTKESEVESEMRQIYTEAPGLVLNWFSPLNLDRWVSAFRALNPKRFFLHDLYTEFVHYLIKSQVPSIPLERESQRLRVYCPPNQRKKLNYKGIEGFIQRTKAHLEFDLNEAINPAERCVMLFRPSMFKQEFRDGFPKGTELIVSLWRGYTEADDFKQVEAAIESCGGRIHYVHASGHIYPEDLIKLIEEINPKQIIPVHTEHPESFLAEFPQTVLLQDGESFGF